jgi:hypothetical protein
MKVAQAIVSKMENRFSEMTLEEIQEVKSVYQQDNKFFIRWMEELLSKIKKKEDIEKFIFYISQLKSEFLEIAPFLSRQLNRIFVLMLKNNSYRAVAESVSLLESCANVRILEILDEFTKNKSALKFLSSVEIYKLKKITYQLAQKFEKTDIAYQIQLELENEDLKWIDHL